MATITPNYELIKPDYSDPVDVDVLNNNADIIDSALAAKANLVGGKVPASELPSYVDDVVEGYYYNGAFYEDSGHTTSITPETGKIYIDLSSGDCYRWTGSVYAKISAADVLIVGYYYNGAFYEDSGHTIAIVGETGKIYVDATTEKNYRWTGSAYVEISPGVEDVQNPQGNSLVNNGIAVVPVVGIENDSGQSLVGPNGIAVIPSPALIEFTLSGNSLVSVLTAGDIKPLIRKGVTTGILRLDEDSETESYEDAYFNIVYALLSPDFGSTLYLIGDWEMSGTPTIYILYAATDNDVFEE